MLICAHPSMIPLKLLDKASGIDAAESRQQEYPRVSIALQVPILLSFFQLIPILIPWDILKGTEPSPSAIRSPVEVYPTLHHTVKSSIPKEKV